MKALLSFSPFFAHNFYTCRSLSYLWHLHSHVGKFVTMSSVSLFLASVLHTAGGKKEKSSNKKASFANNKAAQSFTNAVQNENKKRHCFSNTVSRAPNQCQVSFFGDTEFRHPRTLGQNRSFKSWPLNLALVKDITNQSEVE